MFNLDSISGISTDALVFFVAYFTEIRFDNSSLKKSISK